MEVITVTDTCIYPLEVMSKKSKANITIVIIEKHIKRIETAISCILIVITKTIITETTNPTSVAAAAPFMPYAGIRR